MSNPMTIEDRVLRALVEITGDVPLPLGHFVEEQDIAARVPDAVGVDEQYVRSEAFWASEERLRLMAVFGELEEQGLIKSRGTMGRQAYAPTGSGRERVRRMREDEERLLDARVREAVAKILEELAGLPDWTHLDLRRIGRAGISMEAAEAALRALMEDGLVEREERPGPLLKAGLRLTSSGRDRADAGAARQRPSDGWREAARLRRELEIAKSDAHALIRDEELRRRCLDLLAAEGDYDRVLREACVVLEDRVRDAIGASPELVGTVLMERAFGTNGALRMSLVPAEQVGAMQMFRGLVAFFRNPSGHRLRDDVERDHALRVVVWIDLLLALMEEARVLASDEPALKAVSERAVSAQGKD